MHYVIFAAFFWVTCPAFAGTGVILPPEEAVKLTHQCSRINPSPLRGTWQPTTSQVKELEMRLPAEFARASKAQTRFPEIKNMTEEESEQRLPEYILQYAGLTLGKRHIIYVNAVQRDPQDATWHMKALLMCDGGPSAFGVEYNPSTREFSNFAFNGAI